MSNPVARVARPFAPEHSNGLVAAVGAVPRVVRTPLAARWPAPAGPTHNQSARPTRSKSPGRTPPSPGAPTPGPHGTAPTPGHQFAAHHQAEAARSPPCDGWAPSRAGINASACAPWFCRWDRQRLPSTRPGPCLNWSAPRRDQQHSNRSRRSRPRRSPGRSGAAAEPNRPVPTAPAEDWPASNPAPHTPDSRSQRPDPVRAGPDRHPRRRHPYRRLRRTTERDQGRGVRATAAGQSGRRHADHRAITWGYPK